MSFVYDNRFDLTSNELIKKAIRMDSSGKLFEILTRLKDNDVPSYNCLHMASLLNIYEYTNSIEKVEKTAVLGSNKEPVYSTMQMHFITLGYKAHLPHEYIDFYSQLNKDNKPLFDQHKMELIYNGFKMGMNEKDMALCAKLNKDGVPVYDHFQMDAIISGFIHEFDIEYINLYAKLNNDEKPIYSSREMDEMIGFMILAQDKQMQQLKDAIADGLSFNQFEVLLDSEVPVEKMRIYRALYSLGCDRRTVRYIADNNDLTYDELKKIKYIFACAKKIKELNNQINWEKVDSLQPYNIVYTNLNNLDELYENFAYNICDIHSRYMSPSPGIVAAIKECLKNHIEPEQVYFLISSKYTANEIENISKALIKGANFNKVKELREEAIDILNAEDINYSFETSKEENGKEL